MRTHKILFIVLLLLRTTADAQSPADFKRTTAIIDSFSSANKPDSVLAYSVSAMKYLQTATPGDTSILLYPYVLLRAGRAAFDLGKIADAHVLLTKALNSSRELRQYANESEAFLQLNLLHDHIRRKDLLFGYPERPVTLETEMSFVITKIDTLSADSLKITFNGGRYDGITESTVIGNIYSKYEKDERPTGLVRSYIRKYGNNYCEATATNDSTRPVKVGDFVKYTVRSTPAWQNLPIRVIDDLRIDLTTNYKERIWSSRYLSYYADSSSANTIAMIFDRELKEVVEAYAEDTLTDKTISAPAEIGIFAGKNLVRALNETKPQHLTLFLNFLEAYPRTYMGQSRKFSDTYYRWVFNETQLARNDISLYLMSIPDSLEKLRMFKNLADQISNTGITDNWFSKGMAMANADNSDSALNMSLLLRMAAALPKTNSASGWADYLRGFTEKRSGNYSLAKIYFTRARQRFTVDKNEEGISWTKAAIEGLSGRNSLKTELQTGHLFPYVMAMSPGSRYLATGGSYDKLIKIWDMLAGREIRSFAAHRDNISSLKYSPDGKYLISSSEDSTIKIWNAFDYALLRTIKTNCIERSVIFTPDSKRIVAGGTDSMITFFALSTGKKEKVLKQHKGSVTGLFFVPSNDDLLYSCGSDSMIYKWDITTGEVQNWFREKGKVLEVWVSNNSKYMCSLASDSTIHIWNADTRKSVLKVRSFAESVYGSSYLPNPSFSPDGNYLAYVTAKDTLSVIEISSKTKRDYQTNTGEYSLYNVSFSSDGNYLAAQLNTGGPLRLFNFSGWDFENNNGLNFRDIRSYYSLPYAVQFSADDNELIVARDEISKIDLRTGATTSMYDGAYFYDHPDMLLKDGIRGVYSGKGSRMFGLYNYKEKHFAEIFLLRGDSAITADFAFSNDERKLFLGTNEGFIDVFDATTEHAISHNRVTSGEVKALAALKLDTLSSMIYAVDEGNRVYVFDSEKSRVAKIIEAVSPRSVTYNSKHLFITCAFGEIWKLDRHTFRLIKKIIVDKKGAQCERSTMSGDGKYLAVQFADRFAVIETATDKVLYSLFDHETENGIMAVSHNNKMLATGGQDSKVNIYRLETGEKLATIFAPKGKDFMISDKNQYYAAPKASLDALSFTYNDKSYGFDQFDTKYNRPDLVLAKLGRADATLLSSFEAAYEKRLKKLNIASSALKGDVHLPVVRLNEKFSIRPAVSVKNYELNVECFDTRYPLASLQVTVNNSSIFGARGLPLDSKTMRTIQKINIPIANGVNAVKIWCTNSLGINSLSENIIVTGNLRDTVKAKTYFIGIAVSGYRDSVMNLRFAAKDVRDLTNTFSKIYKKNFEADTLINSAATKENILALREKLLQTKVNDRVIISVNGHGLLSDSLDFYYGTYDVDFKNPSSRGLKYEDLEALLDGIPARQKLLLIDACHSGALDKEELLAQQKKSVLKTSTSDSGSVQGIAARGIIVKNAKQMQDANSSYELMQNMFTDISTGNGAVVISAAGGMEYAFESPKWNNGVFTYCIRKGIEEELADTDGGNQDNYIDVNELKNYVTRKVVELTNGKQKPVSRRENVEFNWIVW